MTTIGEMIEKIAASTSITVDDVIYSIERLSITTPEIDYQKFIAGLQSINDQIKEQKRKQKAIDRIAWEAERWQRYQKGGKWK